MGRSFIATVLALGIAVSGLGIAHAQGGAPPAGPAFSDYLEDFSDTDLSMQMAATVFGPLWYTMLDDGVVMGAEESGRLMGALSLVLNAAALALAALLVIVTTVTGIASTAHEGIALGRRYSTLWVPLRITVAIIMLLPVAGGYSLVQATVMLAAKGGAGVANAAYSRVMDYVYVDVGIITPPRIDGGNELAASLVQSQVCMKLLNHSYPGSSPPAVQQVVVDSRGGIVVTNNNAAPSATDSIVGVATGWPDFLFDSAVNGVQYLTGYEPNPMSSSGKHLLFTSQHSSLGQDICGGYHVLLPKEDAEFWQSARNLVFGAESLPDGTASQTLGDERAAAQWGALAQLNNALEPVSHQLALGATPSPSAYAEAVRSYRTSLEQSARATTVQYRNSIASEANADGDTPVLRGTVLAASMEQMERLGWAAAGALYWRLSALNNQIQTAIGATPTYDGVNVERLTEQGNQGFRDTLFGIERSQEYLRRYMIVSMYDASADLSSAQGLVAVDEGASDAHSTWNTIWARGWDRATSERIVRSLAAGGDPIMRGSSIGHTMVGIAEGVYLGYVAASGVGGAVTGAVGDVPIVGGAIAGAAKGVANALAPAIMTLVLIVLGLGLALAYWLPAIPFVMWIFGMLGWLIMLVEAVVAAPIWAAAHTIPEGEGWAGSHARAGYMLILSLFMRPALMVAGLFAGMLVLTAIGALVSILFPIFLYDADITSLLGLVGFIAALAIFTVIILTSADRSFSLSHIIPDRVLRWISGPVEQLGEHDDTQRTRMIVGGVMSRFEGGMQRSLVGAVKPKVSKPGGPGNAPHAPTST